MVVLRVLNLNRVKKKGDYSGLLDRCFLYKVETGKEGINLYLSIRGRINSLTTYPVIRGQSASSFGLILDNMVSTANLILDYFQQLYRVKMFVHEIVLVSRKPKKITRFV